MDKSMKDAIEDKNMKDLIETGGKMFGPGNFVHNMSDKDMELIYRGVKALVDNPEYNGFTNAVADHPDYGNGINENIPESKWNDTSIFSIPPNDQRIFTLLRDISVEISKRKLHIKECRGYFDFNGWSGVNAWSAFCKYLAVRRKTLDEKFRSQLEEEIKSHIVGNTLDLG